MPSTPLSAPSPELEHDAIDQVKGRLRHRFPDVAPEHVVTAVDEAYRRYDSTRVRTFVPVLVEHEVGDTLAAG
jgi:hypothetical protein